MNIKTKGFTLIELLVVVAIISLLSSVVLASVKEAREKAQQSAYRSYLKEVTKALELYRNDNNAYPTQASGYLLAPIISGPLSNYIKSQDSPANLNFSGHSYRTDLNGSHSCGFIQPASAEPYIVYFISTDPNLKFQKLMRNTIPVVHHTWSIYYFYCVSPTVS